MIVYRDDHALDMEGLARLFRSVGWGERSADVALLAAIVKASTWVVSAWEGDEIVGFARAISDGYTNAYVTDVLVHEAYRREGIATAMVRRLMADRDHIHFVLRAEPHLHPLYEKVGFVPATTMLRRKRRAG